MHDLSKEQIVGLHVKTLYEKFCYLNGLLEQKLDDDAAIKELTNRGFKIEQKSDAQTECFIRIVFNPDGVVSITDKEKKGKESF